MSSENSTKDFSEDSERDDFEYEISEDRRIPEITTEELQNAIGKLKKRANPLIAMEYVPKTSKLATTRRGEMVKLFNEIIKRNNFTPDEWKKVRIKVIHKKGDVENVSNYRPICSLPAMYKLFSTILYGRFIPNA